MSDDDEKSSAGSGSGSDDQDGESGSGEGSGSGSGDNSSDGSGSGSGGGEDSGSGSGSGSGEGEGSGESGEGSSEVTDDDADSNNEFDYKPSAYLKIMSDLKNINMDLDGATAVCDAIESKFSKKKRVFMPEPGLGEEEKKQLLDDIDRELNKSQASQLEAPSQDDQKPRNYHPPESPVRRVYENGVEVGGGGRGQGAGAARPRSGSVLGGPGAQQNALGAPGYPQTLYGHGPQARSMSHTDARSMAGDAAAMSSQSYLPPHPATTTATQPGASYAGAGSAIGYPPGQLQQLQGLPGSNQMSRFANAHQQPLQPKMPPPLPPRRYTDFYRNQSSLQQSMPFGMAQQAPHYPIHPAQQQFSLTPQFMHPMVAYDPSTAPASSAIGSPSDDKYNLQAAIQTLLK